MVKIQTFNAISVQFCHGYIFVEVTAKVYDAILMIRPDCVNCVLPTGEKRLVPLSTSTFMTNEV